MSKVFEYHPTWLYHPIIIDGVKYDFDPSLVVPVPEGHEDFGKTVQQIVGSDKITDAMITENKELDTWDQMRAFRNKLLVECDWTQGEDSPLSTEKKAEWATYRQALRDLPDSHANIINIDDVVWPEEPE